MSGTTIGPFANRFSGTKQCSLMYVSHSIDVCDPLCHCLHCMDCMHIDVHFFPQFIRATIAAPLPMLPSRFCLLGGKGRGACAWRPVQGVQKLYGRQCNMYAEMYLRFNGFLRCQRSQPGAKILWC